MEAGGILCGLSARLGRRVVAIRRCLCEFPIPLAPYHRKPFHGDILAEGSPSRSLVEISRLSRFPGLPSVHRWAAS